MSIEKNIKYIKEEYDTEVARLERLDKFINSPEFETSTDPEQKKLLWEKREVLAKYIAIVKEQIRYDLQKIQKKEGLIKK